MSHLIAVLSFLTASFLYVNEPVVDMREGPTHESKVVSQAIFSEEISVESEFENWAYIKTTDQYEGWVPTNSYVTLDRPYDPSLKVSRLAAHLYGVKDTEYGPIKTIPYGSELQIFEDADTRWIKVAFPDGTNGYVQKGDVVPEKKLQNKEELVPFCQKFLGLPYTWGGRSSFGYDCSGFVQMLYKQIDFRLERDAKQQVYDDRFHTVSIDELEPGDLIFFGKSKDRISHVGMSVGQGKFVHSTVSENQPWIRVSSLSDFQWCGHEAANYPYRIARQLKKKI